MSETRDVLGWMDVDKVWRDRDGDVWRFVEWVGWCYSRTGPPEWVLDEPMNPSRIDGPFTEVLPAVEVDEDEQRLGWRTV